MHIKIREFAVKYKKKKLDLETYYKARQDIIDAAPSSYEAHGDHSLDKFKVKAENDLNAMAQQFLAETIAEHRWVGQWERCEHRSHRPYLIYVKTLLISTNIESLKQAMLSLCEFANQDLGTFIDCLRPLVTKLSFGLTPEYAMLVLQVTARIVPPESVSLLVSINNAIIHIYQQNDVANKASCKVEYDMFFEAASFVAKHVWRPSIQDNGTGASSELRAFDLARQQQPAALIGYLPPANSAKRFGLQLK